MRFNGPPASVNIIFYFFISVVGVGWVGFLFHISGWGVVPTRCIIEMCIRDRVFTAQESTVNVLRPFEEIY